MVDNISQASSDYNRPTYDVKSRVHNEFTSDNYHNCSKSLKSFKRVVYGINYYRNLIDFACEEFVKDLEGKTDLITTISNTIPITPHTVKVGQLETVSARRGVSLAGRQDTGQDRQPGRGGRAATESMYEYYPLPTARKFSKTSKTGRQIDRRQNDSQV